MSPQENAAGNSSRSVPHIFRRWPVVLIELDLDITILCTDRASVVVGHIDAADRHADIIDDCTEFLTGGMICRIAFSMSAN